MQSDSLIKTPKRGGSIAPNKMKIDSTGKIYASANEQRRTPPPNGRYAMSVPQEDRPYDVLSFLRKATYCVRISVAISSNVTFTLAGFVDSGACPNLVDKNFRQAAWR